MEVAGKIYGLSNETYHMCRPYSEYLSSSQLKLYAKSPRYARFVMENTQPQTKAMRFGSLFHDLMAKMAEADGMWSIGFEEWDDTVAVFKPPVNKKTGTEYGAATKVYKVAYDEFATENRLSTILTAEEAEQVVNMGYSIIHSCGSTSENISKLLKWGKPEVSHFLEYEGLKFKFRPDLETNKKIIDYKTVATDDLSEKSINNIISNYGYDISAAFYQFMEHEQSGVWKIFYWLFISKAAPYDAVLVDSSKWTYERDPESDIMIPQVGAIKMKRLLDLHIKCTRDNYYPGAEINISKDLHGNRIMAPAPPAWEINHATEIIEQSFNE